MYYPIKFKPVYFPKPWGCTHYSDFRDDVPEGKVGESWDVCNHKNGESIVANGPLADKTLQDLIVEDAKGFLGTEIPPEWFPLLYKQIATSESLSVQVHPDDTYAMEHEGEMGKTEAWYVVDTYSDKACFYIGLENCDETKFRQAIEENKFEEYLHRIPVKKGDVAYVSPGTIHAIGPDVLVAEINQNSDTTYRVYDYGRGRELHIDKALDVTDLELEGKLKKGLRFEAETYAHTYYCYDRNFSLEHLDIHPYYEAESDPERFHILSCVEGEGAITAGETTVSISLGDSIFIPAALGAYEISGDCQLLKTYQPNVAKLDKEIVDLVKQEG